MSTYLPEGLPRPAPAGDGLDHGYWDGTRQHELRIQRCQACRRWQWGPEWICHRCHSFDLAFEAVEPRGVLFASERVWHPVHPALVDAVPYVVALVELPHADGVRVVGNLLGDASVDVPIGSPVRAVFEDHDDADPPYTLVHWQPH
jgi:uncharacterized protein